jgi:hypothetical protein
MSRAATLNKLISETSGLRERQTPCSRGGSSLAFLFSGGEISVSARTGGPAIGPSQISPSFFS